MHEDRTRMAGASHPARAGRRHAPALWEVLLPPAVLMAVAVVVVLVSPSHTVRVVVVLLVAAGGVGWLLWRLRARGLDRVPPPEPLPQQGGTGETPQWWSKLATAPILSVGRTPLSSQTPQAPVSPDVSPSADPVDPAADSVETPLGPLSAPAPDPRQAPPPRINQGWIPLGSSSASGAVDSGAWMLRLDDGREVGLGVPVLLGRNPQRTQGDPEVNIVPSGGDGRMISRTHVLVEVEDDRAWIVDRGSTNGTAIVRRGGQLEECPVGARIPIDDGQQVAYGNRWFTVCRRS